MRIGDFRRLVDALVDDVPAEYLDGVAVVDVSPRTLPHPVHADVYTMGECVPIHGDGDEVLSRVVLYYGSFQALAGEREAFDWRQETWDTLLHELRHHLEWRAGTEDLEAYDWAADQAFARADGRPFDSLFYEAGERLAPGVYRVEDDVYVDRIVSALPNTTSLDWHGRRYEVAVPDAPLPLFLTVDGLLHPPSGEVVMAFRRRPRFWDLLRRPPPVTERRVEATHDR